jgi:outer membrane lipopolysaccharide assembly protein LptE/RlpB
LLDYFLSKRSQEKSANHGKSIIRSAGVTRPGYPCNKTENMKKIILCLFLPFMLQCGIYTFSGSTLPSHIKTVSIPLFTNKSMEPGVAEELTRMVTQAYITNNTLRVTEKKAHSALRVTLLEYKNEPFTYDAQGLVREYRVVIRASAEFRDEKKNKDIWKNDNIVMYGVYSSEAPNIEKESDGKARAMKQMGDFLIENTISGW